MEAQPLTTKGVGRALTVEVECLIRENGHLCQKIGICPAHGARGRHNAHKDTFFHCLENSLLSTTKVGMTLYIYLPIMTIKSSGKEEYT